MLRHWRLQLPLILQRHDPELATQSHQTWNLSTVILGKDGRGQRRPGGRISKELFYGVEVERIPVGHCIFQPLQASHHSMHFETVEGRKTVWLSSVRITTKEFKVGPLRGLETTSQNPGKLSYPQHPCGEKHYPRDTYEPTRCYLPRVPKVGRVGIKAARRRTTSEW